jgi:hypothetical protein
MRLCCMVGQVWKQQMPTAWGRAQHAASDCERSVAAAIYTLAWHIHVHGVHHILKLELTAYST